MFATGAMAKAEGRKRNQGWKPGCPVLAHNMASWFEAQALRYSYKRARAWHETKLEALYPVAFYGRLLASRQENNGERYFPGPPRIYLHEDGTQRKADHYSRFVQLLPRGIFYAVNLEVLAAL